MNKPLKNVRVVTIATNLPGPLAAARLAAFGADVIKVEPPTGDALAAAEPDWYGELVSQQRVKVIDLKSESGCGEFHALLSGADLLLTSSRPVALNRLGLSWQALSSKYPRLCQVAIVGHSGAAADLPGHDLTYQAEVGLIDGAMPRSPYADFTGAERAVSEVCAALLARELHGQPSYREVSLADAAAYLAEPLRRRLTISTGRLGGGFPGYGIYSAREGHVAVACLEPHFWHRLREGLAVDGTRASIEEAFSKRTAEEWQNWARDRDIPIARIISEHEATH